MAERMPKTAHFASHTLKQDSIRSKGTLFDLDMTRCTFLLDDLFDIINLIFQIIVGYLDRVDLIN